MLVAHERTYAATIIALYAEKILIINKAIKGNKRNLFTVSTERAQSKFRKSRTFWLATIRHPNRF